MKGAQRPTACQKLSCLCVFTLRFTNGCRKATWPATWPIFHMRFKLHVPRTQRWMNNTHLLALPNVEYTARPRKALYFKQARLQQGTKKVRRSSSEVCRRPNVSPPRIKAIPSQLNPANSRRRSPRNAMKSLVGTVATAKTSASQIYREKGVLDQHRRS